MGRLIAVVGFSAILILYGGLLVEPMSRASEDVNGVIASVTEREEARSCGPKLSIETPSCSIIARRDGYELRQYPDHLIWVQTLVANSSYDQATEVGFYRCFYFISGKNSKQENIEMTGPVLIKPVPEQSGYTVSFFVPSRFKSVEDLPVPLDPNVKFVQPDPELHAVVGPFGGIPGAKEYERVWQKLKSILDSEVNMDYDEASLTYAGYSSPFQIINRAQEVHVTVYPHRCIASNAC